MQTQQEKISLVNGRIHTPSEIVSNITFENGRIVSINDEVRNLNGQIIDLQGRTVLPGFCDSGINFLSWAENQERLSLNNIKSVKEFNDSLSAYTHANPKPLRGWYIACDLPDNLIISRDELDSITSSRPCAIIDRERSHAILNSQAMTEFNMPQDSVELDEFSQHLPELSDEDILYLLKTYSPKINALGISEIWIDFDSASDSGRLWDVFSEEAYDLLTFRLRCNFAFNDLLTLNDFLATGLRTGDGLPLCKMGGIIINGKPEQKEEQNNMIYSAHLSGCQIISDNSKPCINALERVIKKYRKNTRHLIKNFNASSLDRMKVLGFGGILTNSKENNFLHETFQNGLVISGGSGENLTAPVKNISGFMMFNEGLSAAEALNLYTWGAAWNGGSESRRGEITLGSDADLVVLEQDPFLVRPDEIAAIDVALTFCAGCAVYESGAI
ncbi:MAG: amidohydrolase family protein [Synergistaceae bacterium]|nr:amidohydrolase family protein [Synergistaceae bacterium]